MVEESGSEVDWAAVRAAHEAGRETLVQIRARFGITESQMRMRRQLEGWAPRQLRAPSRSALIARMLIVLERQIVTLEEQVKRSRDAGDSPVEKEAALLNNMARTLEKLMDLDARERGPGRAAKRPDIAELRARLAERLDRLADD